MDTQAVIDSITRSKKYADICPDAVRRIALECEGRYRNEKALEKAVREKLHGISGAYLSAEDACLPESMDDAALEGLLMKHASTRERLPLTRMDQLYEKLFAATGVPESLLDIACGLNPVYLRARYPAMRVVGLDLSRTCARLSGGLCADLLTEGSLPEGRFDVALMFKILPLMERERPGAGAKLLEEADARYVIASFPTRTMGGRNVGMQAHYEAWMDGHMGARKLVERIVTENEAYYVLE